MHRSYDRAGEIVIKRKQSVTGGRAWMQCKEGKNVANERTGRILFASIIGDYFIDQQEEYFSSSLSPR